MSGKSFPALKPILSRVYFLHVRLYSLPEDNVALTKTSLSSESCLQASMGPTRFVPPGTLEKLIASHIHVMAQRNTSQFPPAAPFYLQPSWLGEIQKRTFCPKSTGMTLHCFFTVFQHSQQWRAKSSLALLTFLDQKIKQ